MTELKPCPFCGGKAEQGYKPNHGYVVYCPNCEIGTGYNDTEEQAIEEWDRLSSKCTDAKPVKRGHLCTTDAYPHHIYCSECNKTLIYNEDICFERNEFPKYCMWCGAELEMETDE